MGFLFQILLLAIVCFVFLKLFYKGGSKKYTILINTVLIVCILFFFAFLAYIASFAYNMKYNTSAKALTESIIKGIESGQSEMVLNELKDLDNSFNATYMNNTKFNENAQRISQNIQKNLNSQSKKY